MAELEGAQTARSEPFEPASVGLGELFYKARDAVIIGEAETGRVVLWNDAAAQIFGYTHEEAESLLIESLVPSMLRDRHRSGLERYARTGRGLLIESGRVLTLPALRKGGEEIQVELTLTPLDASPASARLVMAIVRDVTERVEIQEALRDRTAALESYGAELEQALADLATANQQMRDFVAVAAHELGNPLTALTGFATLLKDRWASNDEEEKQSYLSIILRQAGRLSRLTDDLLTVSRLDAGAIEPRKRPVDLRAALSTAARDVASDAVEISVSVPEYLTVAVDPEHLHRIALNFLANAQKYGAPPFGVEARKTDEWIEVRFRDEGDGVPEEFVPRLFARFSQAAPAGSAAVRGAGLGLSIVRGLVQANGGETWYERNRPRGACFCVRLPRSASREEPV